MADYNSAYTGEEIDAAIGAVTNKEDKATIGLLNNLTTTEKGTLVGAINEINAKPVVVSDGSITLAKCDDDVLGLLNLSKTNLINMLLDKLDKAVNDSDYNQYSDLFIDASGVNAGASNGYTISGGKLTATDVGISTSPSAANPSSVGTNTMPKRGQSFTPAVNHTLTRISTKLSKSGSPSDNAVMKLYATAAGLPSTLIATSTTTLALSSLTGNAVIYDFDFSSVPLTAGTMYAWEVERSGALNDSNYFNVYELDPAAYAGGTKLNFNGTAWSTNATADLYSTISISGSATVILNAKTPLEALAYLAVVAQANLGTGSITYYASDDAGATWIEITPLNTLQNVAFDAASLSIKIVITGDAELLGVAYGGY
jgi:hypothetical protein